MNRTRTYNRRQMTASRIPRARKFFFSIFVAIVFLVVLESAARLIELIDPVKPGDQPTIAEKLPGVFRVFVFGGSTVAGVPIPDLGFVSQLEFWLRRIRPEVPLDVYNFGSSGEPSRHVLRLVKQTIGDEPDLLIVLTGHNEFLSRSVEGRIEGGVKGIALWSVRQMALMRVVIRVQNKVRLLFLHPSTSDVMPTRQVPYDRGSALFRDKVERYHENLRRIAEIARQRKIPLILATAPANVADWPPVHKHIVPPGRDAAYESSVRVVAGLVEDRRFDEAVARVGELLRTYPNDSMLLYLSGRAHTAVGDRDTAGSHLTRAKDLDPIPMRALSAFNEAVRRQSAMEGVHLADLASILRQHAPGGLVGFSLIVDNCHPTPTGNAIISRELIRIMAGNRLFLEGEPDLPDPSDQLEVFLTASTTPESRPMLDLAYLLWCAKYAMKTPFYNFAASKMHLEKALALDATDWRIWVNLATISLLEGRTDAGRSQLIRAIALRGGPMDPDDRAHAPYLKEALDRSGIALEHLVESPSGAAPGPDAARPDGTHEN